MELQSKTRPELWDLAKQLKLDPPKSINDEELRGEVEQAMIRRTVEIEEKARSELKAKAQMKQNVAELKAAADLAKVKLLIPDDPTIDDIARLRKELGIKKNIPKPSPETIAIEKSERVYAIFHNQEQDDADVKVIPGGVYRFHFFPEKVHCIPKWLIGYYNKQCVVPILERRMDKITGETRIVKTGVKRRFLFEVLEDAPVNEPFGVVTDEKILKKFPRPM